MNSFRIFDKKNNTYLDLEKEHYLIDNDNAVFIAKQGEILSLGKFGFVIEWGSGLFDKHGLEIYHNDILANGMHTHGPVLVQYDVGMAGFELVSGEMDDETHGIMGYSGAEHLFDTTNENDLGYNIWEVIGNKNEHVNLYEQLKNPQI